MDDHAQMPESKSTSIEYVKFVLIIAAITVLSTVIFVIGDTNSVYEWMRWFMGVFFVTFALFKLIGYKMFVVMFQGYDVIAKKIKLYSYLYPFIELSLGLMYLFDLFPVYRDAITVLVFGIASIGVVQEIVNRRSSVHCACLGNVIKLPLSTVSFVEDFGMAIMAIIMIIVM